VTRPTDLVQGTLDLLIMRTIATEKLHGWAIAQRIQLLSRDVLQVNQRIGACRRPIGALASTA
jgi:PadR family transcriptional regulator PadR